MKNPLILFALVIISMAAVPTVARAGVIAQNVTMDHGSLYTLQINSIPTIQSGYFVSDATLTVSGLTNWANEDWKLWVNLMDQKGANAGLSSWTDPRPNDVYPFHNDLPWGGTQLGSVTGHTTASTTWVHSFSQAELTSLTAYINNGGNIAFGFDPDCHFNISSISFGMDVGPNNIPPSEVPEPASIVLVGTALLASLGTLRRKRAQRS